MSKNQMQPILRAFFEEYLPDVKGVSANTLRSYRYSFRLLFQFLYEKNGILPAKVDFSNIDGNTVLSFLQWLEESRECSVSTRNQRLAAIRSFSSYASRHCFQSALAFGTAVASIPPKRVPKKAMAYTVLLDYSGDSEPIKTAGLLEMVVIDMRKDEQGCWYVLVVHPKLLEALRREKKMT